MSHMIQSLGTVVKKYRKAKGYSTKSLSEKLDVSTGLINNIENAKNDVFKIDLLMNLIMELEIPIAEIISCEDIPAIDVKFKPFRKTFEIYLGEADYISSEPIANHLKLVISTYIKTINEFEDKEKAMKYLSDLLVAIISAANKIKSVK